MENMMDNSKITPIQLVELYHSKYVEYENAFHNEPADEKKLEKEIEKIVKSGTDFDSPEFEQIVIDLMVEKPAKRIDVDNSARKFYIYADFYTSTQEEELPIDIKKDYVSLKEIYDAKPMYSIEAGKFVKNDSTPIEIDKEKLRELYQQIKKSVEGQ